MRVTPIRPAMTNQNFTGIKKVVTQDVTGKLTKFFTQKGEYMGYSFADKNHFYAGTRKFAKGGVLTYATEYSPNQGKFIKFTTSGFKNRNRTFYLPADTIEKNPDIITKKGVQKFLADEETRLQKAALEGKAQLVQASLENGELVRKQLGKDGKWHKIDMIY